MAREGLAGAGIGPGNGQSNEAPSRWFASICMHDRQVIGIDDLLLSIFGDGPAARQPRILTGSVDDGADHLKVAYQIVRDRTPRGRELADHPLRVIGLVSGPEAERRARETLAGIPHALVHAAALADYFRGEIETIDGSGVVFFEHGPAGAAAGRLTADAVLMAAAAAGLFPRRECFRLERNDDERFRVSINTLDRRPYQARLARAEDLPSLLRLEEACWSSAMRTSADELLRRLKHFPSGQCVLEFDGEVVAAIYSQRIHDFEQLCGCRYADLSKLHDETGSTVQLLAISVSPEQQHLGLGDDLLDLMLMRSALQPGVRQATAITRCRDFRGATLAELDAYVRQTDDAGRLVDPILLFHQSHGAKFDGVLRDCRPEDEDNLGTGVLIHYELESLFLGDSDQDARSTRNGEAWRDVGGSLESAMLGVLGPGRRDAFGWTRPLRDMALDSLDLLGFRTLLQRMFGRSIPPTLFFSCPTLADIRRHIEASADDSAAGANKRMTDPVSLADISVLEPAADTAAAVARNSDQGPIAVVGMAGRFPGCADLEGYWDLLAAGRNGITRVPAERWDADAYYSPDSAEPGKIVTRAGGFIEDIDRFDAAFFSISPREAELMDPQQRLLLELHWEALEKAGIDPRRLRDATCGIFVGQYLHDYELLQVATGDTRDLETYDATGNAASIAAGRLAYFFGTRGPAMTLDTACSSSLVAVHQAIRSLRYGECDLAMASGANLILSPRLSIAFSRAGMLSPDGACKTFDARADGYVRAEGCGVVVLKRLQDALRDGDNVLAVLRGSAINQDGASNGLTAPNLTAQAQLLRQALSDAGLEPADIDYIEAHGTGTSLGDPVEFAALREVYGADSARKTPLWLGSVKTNIGHAEAAAGIAGLVKVVLALQHSWLPAHLHFESPNPHIDLESLPARIPVNGQAWRSADRPLRAGVSSFGFSGTNAHVVVEQAPPRSEPASPLPERGCHLLGISAKNRPALRELLRQHSVRLAAQPDVAPGDLCYTANGGRAHHDFRLACRFQTSHELAASLRTASERVAELARVERVPRVAFLFTGQGSQYPGMARELALTEPAFRAALSECCRLLDGKLARPLESLLYPGDDDATALDDTANTQPALFSVEYSLARMMQSWGIEPSAVLGHSVGEYVAACIAGVFSLPDALKLIAARGRLMSSLPRNGAMIAVLAPAALVHRFLEESTNGISVAAFNGPENIVLSGDATAIAAAGRRLESAGARVVPLQVSHAFHSELMEPMLPALADVAGEIQYAPPGVQLVSNLSGELATQAVASPEYWLRHTREAVQFERGIRTLAASGVEVMLEIGPHPVLKQMGPACISGVDRPLRWLHLLERGVSDWDTVTAALGELYEAGAEIDWRAMDTGRVRRRISLPTYPWQRERYWLKPSSGDRLHQHQPAPADGGVWQQHVVTNGKGEAHYWQAEMSTAHPPGVQDHVVQGLVAMPAAGMISLALAAAAEAFGDGEHVIESFDFMDALILGESPRKVQLAVRAIMPGTVEATFSSPPAGAGAGDWTVNARGTLVLDGYEDGDGKASAESVATNRPSAASFPPLQASTTITGEAFYDELEGRGLSYGPRFRRIRELRRGDGAVEAVLDGDDLRWGQGKGPPVDLLDACLQVMVGLAPTAATPWVPVGMGRLVVRDRACGRQGLRVEAVRRPVRPGATTFAADARIVNEAGLELALMENVRLQGLESMRAGSVSDWFHEIEWKPVAVSAARSATFGPSLPPEALTDRLAQARDDALSKESPAHLLMPELESLCGDFIAAALHRLGWSLRRGERNAARGLAGRLGVAERHERLLERLLEILQEDGVLVRENADWVVDRAPAGDSPEARLQGLVQRFPECAVELALFGRCAAGLDEVLKGERDPLQLLFPQGSLADAGTLYRDSPFSRVCNAMVAEAIRAVTVALPQGRTLRILEIGAGTGGTTAHVLPLLDPQHSRYVFTDVSTLFTSRAAEKFRDFPFVDYRLLDISTDFASQGFEAGEFDLVIAANVLHATPDLGATLGAVRDLLAPGGRLLLVEGIEAARWIDLIFGLTEGWWLFKDRQLRPSHPLVSKADWPGVLERAGFECPVIVGNARSQHEVLFEQAVILTGRPAAMQDCSAQRWIVFQDAAGTGQRLASELSRRGVEVIPVAAAEQWRVEPGGYGVRPDVADDYGRVLEDLGRKGGGGLTGIACLWPLDVAHDTAPEKAQAATCDALACLCRALVGAEGAAHELARNARLWILTRGTQATSASDPVSPLGAAAWGVGRVMALEHPELRPSLLDLDSAEVDVEAIADELLANDAAAQVCLRSAGRREARLVRSSLDRDVAGERIELPANRPGRLVVRAPGTLDALEYRTVKRRRPGPGEVEIRVHAAGLNFRDVVLALGMLPDKESSLGLDVAGEVVAIGAGVSGFAVGDPVMSFAEGGFGTFVTVRQERVIGRPAGLDEVQAAAVPVVFLTAWHALRTLARIRAGDRVLIHAATGGVGMAAVQIALRAGCEVFGTAGSARKRNLLRESGVQHVFDSRSTDFAAKILALTGGSGVDVVLNSLAGDFIRCSFDALAADGRFIEIGKMGVWSREQARAARPDAFYEVFDLITFGRDAPECIAEMLVQIRGEFEAGHFKPLPVRLFPANQAGDAFRTMSQAGHVGKIVISFAGPASGETHQDSQLGHDLCQGTALVSGAYGGLGILLVEWLAARGVRTFALIGRRPPDAEVAARLAALEQSGATILCARGDIAAERDVRALLQQSAETLPPIGTVFHCAGVLDDGALPQLHAERFSTVLRPKVHGALHLDRLTRELPIRRFVCFSSYSSLFGSRGQANHAAANACLDALVHARRTRGQPAQSINWGPWQQVGAAADYALNLAPRGIGSFSPAAGLQALEQLLRADRPQTAVVPFDLAKWLAAYPAARRSRLFDSLSAEVPVAMASDAAASGIDAKDSDIRARLAGTTSPRQRSRLLETWLREQAAAVLRAPIARVEGGVPLKSLGFDSLLAVEFRNRLESQLGLALPATLIWNYPTIGQLCANLLEQLARQDTTATTPASSHDPKVAAANQPLDEADLLALSEEAAEEQLARRLENLEGSG